MSFLLKEAGVTTTKLDGVAGAIGVLGNLNPPTIIIEPKVRRAIIKMIRACPLFGFVRNILI